MVTWLEKSCYFRPVAQLGDIREVLQYIPQFRGRTFLVLIEAGLLPEPAVAEPEPVVTEAMASGLAILAFDYAAASRYLRHEENGLLAPFADKDAFLAQASRLAESDPRRRRRLGLAARLTAENIPWSRVIDGFVRDLCEVAGSPSERHADNPAPRT